MTTRPHFDWTHAEWMVRVRDLEAVGPVSLEQLESGLHAGKVPPDAFVARAGTTEWQLAAQLIQLARGAPPAQLTHQPANALASTVALDPLAAAQLAQASAPAHAPGRTLAAAFDQLPQAPANSGPKTLVGDEGMFPPIGAAPAPPVSAPLPSGQPAMAQPIPPPPTATAGRGRAKKSKPRIGLMLGIVGGVALCGVGSVFAYKAFFGAPAGLQAVVVGTFGDLVVLPNGPIGVRPLEDKKPEIGHVVISRPKDGTIRAETVTGFGVVEWTQEFELGDDDLIEKATKKNRFGRTIETLTYDCKSTTKCIVKTRTGEDVNAVAPCAAIKQVVFDDATKIVDTCIDEDGEPILDHDGVSQVVSEREVDGPAKLGLRRVWFQNEGGDKTRSRRTYAFATEWKRNDKGCVTQMLALDGDGEPMNDPSGIHEHKYQVDGDCDVISTRFLDEKGKKTRDGSGVHKVDYKRTRGVVTARSYFDVEDEPMRDTSLEAHSVKNELNDDGFVISISYLDAKGEELNTANGHLTKIEVDEQGSEISRAHFFADGSKAVDGFGTHRAAFTYNDAGLVVKREQYSARGKLTRAGVEDAPVVKFAYDDAGRRISTSFWLSDDKPTLNKAGYHEEKAEYGDDGCKSEYAFFDTAGKPTAVWFGVHKRTFEMDADCNPLEVAHFDTAGGKVGNSDGAHRIVNKYADGNLVKEAFFDSKDKPFNIERHHEKRFGYDKLGRVTSESYFDTDGKPTVVAGGVHKKSTAYDKLGRVTRRTHVGTDDEPAHHPTDQHIVEIGYDDGGRVIERSYRGPDGTPAFHDGEDYHIVTYTYDEAGRRSSETFWMGDKIPGVQNKYSDAHKIETDYDDNGCIKETRQLGVDGKPQGKQGQTTFERNLHCNVLQKSVFGADESAVEDDSGVHRYEYDVLNGRVVAERRFDKSDGKVDASSDGAFSIKRTFDDDGHILSVKRFDQESKPTSGHLGHETRFTYDDNGHTIEELSFDGDGKAEDRANTHRTAYQRDAFGREIDKTTFNAAGQASVDYRDVHRAVKKHDRFGRVTEEASYLESGKAKKDSDETQVKRKSYDATGDLTTESYWNSDGEAAEDDRGVHVKKYTYDSSHRRMEETYFDKDGQPTLDGFGDDSGIHKVVVKRNAVGDRLERLTFGKSGEAKNDLSGHHRVTTKVDRLGAETEMAFWTADGSAGADYKGVHKLTIKRDARGNPTELAWFDKEGKPQGKGADTRRMVNDARGNWVSQKPFKDGSPVTYERPFCLNGYHEIRRSFDARNRVSRIDYFSTASTAAECTDICNTRESFHRVDFIYEDGKLVKQELYKAAGSAVDKTLDCTTGYCISPNGLNSTMGGR